MTNEKKTEQIKVLVGSTLYVELARLADDENRSVSEYVRHVMTQHVFGHKRTVPQEGDEA